MITCQARDRSVRLALTRDSLYRWPDKQCRVGQAVPSGSVVATHRSSHRAWTPHGGRTSRHGTVRANQPTRREYPIVNEITAFFMWPKATSGSTGLRPDVYLKSSTSPRPSPTLTSTPAPATSPKSMVEVLRGMTANPIPCISKRALPSEAALKATAAPAEKTSVAVPGRRACDVETVYLPTRGSST